MSNAKKKTTVANSVAENRKARHEYHIEANYEAGVVLEGWEVKSIREGRIQLQDSYVIVKHGEVWLIGTHITPLLTASTHISPDPLRTRKLLLHKAEINKLIGAVERKGYTLIPLSLYWKKNRLKLNFGLAKGKQAHDKREDAKARSWSKEKQKLLKTSKNLN